MAEELQALIDRLQKDGVDKARAGADQMLAEARAKAEAIVREGEAKARAAAEKAEAEAKASAERGRKALEQASRDVLLATGEAIASLLSRLLVRDAGKALAPAALAPVIESVVKAHLASKGGEARIEVLVPAAQQKEICSLVLARLAAEAKQGFEIKGEDGLVAGFRVSCPADKVEHDFSAAAIADAIGRLVRPGLAEIVRDAGKK